MTDTFDIAPEWPLFRHWALTKGRGRPSPRHEDLERLAAIRTIAAGMHGGGPPFGGGRGRRRRGDVRIALLMALAEEPRNGYQLMQTIEERSGGRWRPSPGAVYPALAQLEDEGFVKALERDGTRLFEITDAGREYLEQRHDSAAPWDSDEDGATITDMKDQLKQAAVAAAQVMRAGDEAQIAKASEVLREARRALYRILAEEPNA
jgi:DNA-binding PadR family transcriptional regulator